MAWAPTVFVPAPIGLRGLPSWLPGNLPANLSPSSPFADSRLTPHYPAHSPLDDVLRLASPGTDEYTVEGYVSEIVGLLGEWSRRLKTAPPASDTLAKFIDSSIQSHSFSRVRETDLRPGDPIEVIRREFESGQQAGAPRFVENMKLYLSSLIAIETADFTLYECSRVADAPLTLESKILYEFVGVRSDRKREGRTGSWLVRWTRDPSKGWQAVDWRGTTETVSRTAGRAFIDITSQTLGRTSSYKEQLAHGADYWRTLLDSAIGVDVYGNNGLAVGDFDSDGFDDLYICQPAGLPNRLYHNRGDGTFEDVTASSGVGVLDFTACALFADFDNRGLQDLLVVCSSGPLLFSNQGNGKFSLKPDAFHFARAPQGAFTHAAIADYDRDGRLDIYFCLYNYYQGLDQYRYPVPYFDARNGPPNYLFHNEGSGVFDDRTEAAGLNAENDRYSFACSWGDSNGDGWPDLYVVNDFGRNNLYRNNGNGTFTPVSSDAHVDEAGAGMSACWLDSDNSGTQDIYAAGMWVAAGIRVFGDPHFHPDDSPAIRELYRRHMAGNSLYRNQGNGQFQNVATKAGVEMGRWSWSSDSWDFDHDGYPDLYVTNGYISGVESQDVSSFFWRQVVAKSPHDSSPSTDYERGWGAINELIRSDSTWNGRERNVFFANNRDGTFSDVSGVIGMDFREDSRTFALADLDGDGRLEVVLKNRNAPQIRVLRNAKEGIGNSISFRLRGQKSNRDAIGTAITLEAGPLRQKKYLQAGSGFLCQHTKELSFGVGKHQETIKATVQWPGGITQTFDALPINHRIELVEGSASFQARPFLKSPNEWIQPGELSGPDILPSSIATWLIDPVKAPDFSLPDLSGNLRDLNSLGSRYVLLVFWTINSVCIDQLHILRKAVSSAGTKAFTPCAINVDDPSDMEKIQGATKEFHSGFPVLIGSRDIAGIYNLVYRYMFDRHRDMSLPTAFLLDEGRIVKVYQGSLSAELLTRDLENIPRTSEDRRRNALPFQGTLVQDTFQRNSFTYGIAFFQHGFPEPAADSFKQAIAERPDDAEAYYNLGTLYLRSNSLMEAQQYLEQTVKLRPNYADAWNNLGTIAAQEGNTAEAIRNFERAVELRPTYTTALLNLGNVYRKQNDFEHAEKFLKRALESEPNNAEVSYSIGMLYARTSRTQDAIRFLQGAIAVRPGYSDALNNLGVLLVQQKRYPEAEEKFDACIRESPDFDQPYLNLARLYVIQGEKEKARTVLESLLKRQPQHQMAQQMLRML